MTKLSATATAILEAYDNSPFEYYNADNTAIAAVIRAVAAQIVLFPRGLHINEYLTGVRDTKEDLHKSLLAIADEFEAFK